MKYKKLFFPVNLSIFSRLKKKFFSHVIFRSLTSIKLVFHIRIDTSIEKYSATAHRSAIENSLLTRVPSLHTTEYSRDGQLFDFCTARHIGKTRYINYIVRWIIVTRITISLRRVDISKLCLENVKMKINHILTYIIKYIWKKQK